MSRYSFTCIVMMKAYNLLLMRLVLFVLTAALIYFAINDEHHTKIPHTIIILALFILIERYVASLPCDADADTELSENFNTTTINKLNSLQGVQGQFYVDCPKCGRMGQKQKQLPPNVRYGPISCKSKGCGCANTNTRPYIQEVSTPCYACNAHPCRCGRYQTKGPDVKYKGCHGCKGCKRCEGNTNRSYCTDRCVDTIGRDTVSLYNDKFIDLSETGCYNCALDIGAKIEQTALNYRELPIVNGPPGYSVYLDKGYSM